MYMLREKLPFITTGISVVLWAIIASIILSGVISIRDIDSWTFNRMGPLTGE